MRFLLNLLQARKRIAIVATVLIAVSAGAAFAWFMGTLATGSNASAASSSLPTGSTPVVSLSGASVTISWSQNTVGGELLGTYNGGGYAVKRYPASGGSAVTPGSNCNTTTSGSTSTLTCTENSVPAGSWKYTVTPVLNNWVGTESAQSATVSTGSISLSPTSGHVGDTVTISGSNFPSSSTISATYDGSALTLSPATPSTDGSGNIPAGVTFTVPASTKGTHSVQVSAGGQTATATFTVSPKITLAPTSGVAGTSDTITGSGFAASSTISATFGGSSVTLTGGSSDSSGSFSATYTVPNQPAGAATVIATDGSSNSAQATYTINTPSIGLSPSTGHVADSVTLSGSNFPANSAITATYGGSALTLSGTTTTDASGNVPSGVTFTVPSSTAGGHTIQVTAGTRSASATFTVTPSITLNPTSGIVGSSDSISGTGFAANSTLTAKFGTTTVSLSGTTSSDSNGSFSGATYTLPPATAGGQTVKVSDSASTPNSGTATFTVTPSITLNPTTSVAGATDTIIGTGFAGSSTITATFGGASVTLTNGSATSSGSFSATYTVPNQSPGSHSVVATDGSGNNASAGFTIPTPRLSFSPLSSGNVGDTITLTGTNLPANQSLSATYDGASLTLSGTTTTNAFGQTAANLTFTVPASAAGGHAVQLTAAGQSASNTFTVQPKITLTPTTGNVGSTDTITGTGFAANSALTAKFNTQSVTLGGATTTDANGSFSGATYAIPANPAQGYPVFVSDSATPTVNTAQSSFTITASITLTPSSGVAGTSDTISGTGFGGSKTITATFGGSPITLTGGTSNSSGSFSATYTVPNNAPGGYSVVASDGAGNSPSATYTISTPSIMLNPTSGHVGDSVSISGSGFPASSTITAKYDGATLTLSGTTTTDSSGNIPSNVSFTVPASTKGNHTVQLTAGGQSASATFTVSPKITINPTSGYAGSSDVISGTGFAASSTITATFNGSAVTLTGTTATDANGSFTGANYTVPTIAAGSYSVVVRDSASPASSASTSYTLVAPSIGLNPTSGHVGDTVTISGSSFPASSTITAKYDSATLTLSPASPSTDSSGNIPSSVTFTVPASVQGSHTIQVTAGGQSATATLTVNAQITLSPDSGNDSGNYTDSISGTGFPASSSISATFSGSPVTISGTTTTTANGSFTGANYTVPSSPSQNGHLVTATVGTTKASATFYVFQEIDEGNAANTTSGSRSVAVSSINVLSSTVYLILVSRNSSTNDGISSINVTNLSTPTLITSQSYNGGTAYQWAYYATGTAIATGSVTVNFKNALGSNQSSNIDIVRIFGENLSNPIASNFGTANGSSATATANMPNPPSAGDAETVFLASPGNLGGSTPGSTPTMTNLFYANGSKSTIGSYWNAAAVQNESLAFGSNIWGTIALEINHP